MFSLNKNTLKKHKLFIKMFLILLLITRFVYPVDVVYQILHIGDSVSKLGVQDAIRAWLTANHPTIEYVSTTNNDNGIVVQWCSNMWNLFYKYDPDIILVNSGIWDRDQDTLQFQERIRVWAGMIKAAHPKARIVWASGTLTNGLQGNDTISSNNDYAQVVLDSVFGIGEWYFIDMEQVQIDSSVAFSGDNIHPASYDIYAGEWINTLDTIIPVFTNSTIASVDTVSYGVCKTGNRDFKTGAPTITISNDTAYLSVAQDSAYMGSGAAIWYNSGTVSYIKHMGKIDRSTWRVSTATGGVPAPVSGVTIDSINLPFDGLNDAFTNHVGANYINNTIRSYDDANLCVYLSCYINGDETPDGAATFNASSGDMAHQIYIYSPTDTFMDCNIAQFTSTNGFDSSKYHISAITNSFVKNTVNSFLNVFNLQIYMNRPVVTTVRQIVSINPTENFDFIRFDRCVFATETPSSGSGIFRGLYFGTTGAGSYIVNNSLLLAKTNLGTNTGDVFQTATGVTVDAYGNTICGDWEENYLRTAGYLNFYNNVVIGLVDPIDATTSSHDYNIYNNVDEGETNGKYTTQTDAELFTTYVVDDEFVYNYKPLVGGDIDSTTISFTTMYNTDLNGFVYDSATANAGGIQLYETVLDSVRVWPISGAVRWRDSTYHFACRAGDTITFFGKNFDDSSHFSFIGQNSTGTVSPTILGWYNNSDIDSIVAIPYGAVPGFYKPYIVTKDSSVSATDSLWVKKPGRL